MVTAPKVGWNRFSVVVPKTYVETDCVDCDKPETTESSPELWSLLEATTKVGGLFGGGFLVVVNPVVVNPIAPMLAVKPVVDRAPGVAANPDLDRL